MADDHGHCPNCNADLNGGLIYQTFIDQGKSPEEALKISMEWYDGANETKGRWGRQIGLYSIERDRTYAYQCPDCGHEWPC